MNTQPILPSCESLLERQDVSYWLKHALRQALQRDPVDAARDAELLADVLRHRADAMLGVAAARKM